MLKIIRKILKLLTVRERKRFYLLFGVMTISGIIEVVGVASIMPFLSLVTNISLIDDNQILNWVYKTLNFESANRFLVFVGIAVLLVLVVSNLMTFLTSWGLARYAWMRNYTVSRRLLSRYLHQPYIFFLNRNTSTLGKNILFEVHQVIKGVIVPLMQIFAQGIGAVLILALLIAMNPTLALSLTAVFGGAYLFIYRLVKQKLHNIGKLRISANTERYKIVNETFGGIKLLKLTRCEDYFIKCYSKPSAEFARYNTINQMIGYIPRYLMEIIAFGGIIGAILYMLVTGRGFEDYLPLIGLFAYAIYRLMPALQAIFVGITNLRFNIPVLDTLYEDMFSFKNTVNIETASKEKVETLPLKKELRLEDIEFSYPDTKKPVISNLNISINVNTSVAFVGTTGVGKTTIADIILGLLRPYKGKILIDGVEVTDENMQCWQRNLGYIPQDIYLQDDSVARNIAFGIPDKKIDMDAVERSARIANIHDFIVEQLSDKYETVIGERGIRLSGGQRQRIGIARALYHDPELLVLDEATSALDRVTEREVFTAIQNIAKSKTLIIIAHRLTTIEGCDVIYVLENGKVVGSGKYKELLESNKIFKKLASAH